MGDVVDAPVSELWDANGAEPSTSFSAREAAVLACRAAWAEMLAALVAKHACSERPGDGTLVPPMRGCDAACPQAPPVRPLSGLVVHLCGGCGYVGTAEREPDPPPPKWLRPTRGVRYSLFRSRTPMIQTWMTSQRRG